MTKICPQCNHFLSKLVDLSVLAGCTPPQVDDEFCVKCGTKLIDENTEAITSCPKCYTPRRKKAAELNIIPNSIDPNDQYSNFCSKCGHKFVD